MSSVLTCTSWDDSTSTCSQFQLIEEVYLIPASQQELIEFLSTGGFSSEAFGIGFTGVLTVCAVGMATGLIVSQVRKLKP